MDKPPEDPADHAEEFAWRYVEDLDIVAGQTMMDLGIPSDKMGAGDPARLGAQHSFHPGDREGGTVTFSGRITLDSGLMNPELLAAYDEETQMTWKRTRLRDRAQAIIAHELTEFEVGDHEGALKAAPSTALPISHAARELLKQMERGWKKGE